MVAQDEVAVGSEHLGADVGLSCPSGAEAAVVVAEDEMDAVAPRRLTQEARRPDAWPSNAKGTEDSGQTTSFAPRAAASSVRRRWRPTWSQARDGLPLDVLRDAGLDEPHADPAGLATRAAPAARRQSPRHARHENTARLTRASRRARRPLANGAVARGAPRPSPTNSDTQVHSADGRELDGLGTVAWRVPEKAPRKLPERVDPHHLGGHPEDGSQEDERRHHTLRAQASHPAPTTAGKRPENEAQQHHHGDADGQRHPAELRHHERGPVDEAERRDDTGDVAEEEPWQGRGSAKGHEQRCESEEAHGAVTELRKRQGEQDSGNGRQSEAPTRSHECSSAAISSGVERRAHEHPRVDRREARARERTLRAHRTPRVEIAHDGRMVTARPQVLAEGHDVDPSLPQIRERRSSISSSLSPRPTMRPLFVTWPGSHRP